MKCRVALFAFGVAAILARLVHVAGRVEVTDVAEVRITSSEEAWLTPAVARLNGWFQNHWQTEQVVPAEPADELLVLRRLSLALHGTVPALEEIRDFEADTEPDRLQRWTLRMLQDQRFSDYFSERLVRSLVGVEDGPFILFRRDRLTTWLSEQLRNDTPWPDLVSALIASDGLWTDQPATNFVTSARISDEEGIDENRLAGRTVRVFLGQRIDCAQCHDHPFDDRWKQADFEGLAAWFGQVQVTVGGITDRPTVDGMPVEYRVADPAMPDQSARLVRPAVPFHADGVAREGSRRQQLASWIVHPKNRRFERAVANRIWGLMFGQPLHAPVDDLAHPSEDAEPDALDILGAEFRAQGGRLSTLIRLIAASRPFRLSSESAEANSAAFDRQLRSWAVFPLVPLRSEQIVGAMIQAGSVRTVDQNSNLLIRFLRFVRENDFVNEYGDAGDEELMHQPGTIPQALMRMNGKLVKELTEAEGFSAPGQILQFAADDVSLVETCFLTCLSRRPEPEEMTWFADRITEVRGVAPDDTAAGGTGATPVDSGDRPARQQTLTKQHVQDLYWILFNSPEFSWNH